MDHDQTAEANGSLTKRHEGVIKLNSSLAVVVDAFRSSLFPPSVFAHGNIPTMSVGVRWEWDKRCKIQQRTAAAKESEGGYGATGQSSACMDKLA